MAYFRECEHCGAALDPGERCDCAKARTERKEHELATKRIKKEEQRTVHAGALFPINKAV